MLAKSSVSLKTISRLRVGGTAKKVYYPETITEFVELLKKYPKAVIIGGGSNVFFADRTFAVIIITAKLNKLTKSGARSYWAECGVPLPKLFSFAAGVPATVGGGLWMNFGAFRREIQEFVEQVEIYDLKKKQVTTLAKKEIHFGYRHASFEKNKQIILRAKFTQKYLLNSKKLLKLRQTNMPYDKPNIGSIFRNPQAGPAGYFIEAAGLKEYSVGNAMVSPKHANIIINTGNATANDVINLIKKIQNIVKAKFNVELKPEVKYVK
jgi:UDP-N-acetylmuramate dehydrogenase